jgi:hypothetical protein
MASTFREIHLGDSFERPALRVSVLLFLALAAAYTAFRYFLEITHGGQVWTTGGWLVSYRAGFVRRGLTGSLTFGISDLTGLNAIYVAAAMQFAIYAAMVASVLFILSRVKMTTAVALLAISPVFLLMPFYFVKLAMIQEMVGFLAISLVATSAFTNRRWPFWAGIGIFGLSGFAHEINAFLAPILLVLVLILAWKDVISRRQALIGSAIAVVAAGAAILTSVIFNGNGMGNDICQVILSYGGRAEYCGPDGPTVWLDRDVAYGMHYTWVANVESGVWPWFILGFILAMAPFLLFRVANDTTGRQTILVFLLACVGILVFSPMFVIATDWGRWISMHVFGLTILTFVSLRLGLLEERFPHLHPVILTFGLVWALPDFGEPMSGGMLRKAMTVGSRAEQFLQE